MQVIRYISFLLFLLTSIPVYSQDTTFAKYYYDTTFARFLQDRGFPRYNDSIVSRCWLPLKTTIEWSFDFIYHLPDEEDEKMYESNKYLIDQLPTEKNHVKYIQLAAALWNLEKTKEAEKMFLNIVNSKIKSYTTTYYHSSDIPGDTTTNSYGYGSSTSNYKNTACLYLTKINIEKKKFQTALAYLEQAIKKYKVTYTCGTGYNMQKNEYDFLYAACYEGLGYHKKNIDMLLPTCLDWDNKILTRAIKRTYSGPEIENYLFKAEKSITCSVDTFLSESVVTSNYGTEEEKKDTIRYYSGSGSIILFNRKIDLPYPHLEDGEKVLREYYVKLFKESSFYEDLIDKKEIEDDE